MQELSAEQRIPMLKYLHNFFIAMDAIMANRVRAGLTMLGIIFGVMAVIAMLAIGEGAQQEILEQMKLVGVNNIVITPVVSKKNSESEEESSGKKEKKKFSPGLTLADAGSIMQVLPMASSISPEVSYDTKAINRGVLRQVKLAGVTQSFFSMLNFRLSQGNFFSDEQMRQGMPVCIIGNGIKTRLFSTENPMGGKIKCGKVWLEVIGVLGPMHVAKSSEENLGISDFDQQVYVPLQTVLLRFKNRALITTAKMRRGGAFGGAAAAATDVESEAGNYHQLDRMVVQVMETEQLTAASEIIKRMLLRRHSGVEDFEIKIPELLLKQQQETKNRFKFLLAAIAAISLIVGGIGIMNIMLASVMERTKEIGIRLSMGATKRDIVLQFLTESVFLSVTGGLIGVALGITFAVLISKFSGFATVISVYSILISFMVSAGVGIIFGIMPAKRAAGQDPVLCLRYE